MQQKNVLILSQPVSHIRLGGIAKFAKNHGWHLVIADRLSRLPIGWTGDGALVSARGPKTTLKFIMGLVNAGAPVVDMTIDHPEIAIPRVSGDHVRCGQLAARHFVERHFGEAAFLLKNTEMPIKQVANDLGFSSAAHLTAAFRQHFGITPAAFRHQHLTCP